MDSFGVLQRGSYNIVLSGLELSMQIRLAMKSQSYASCLPSTEIKNGCYHNRQGVFSYNQVDHHQSFIWSNFIVYIFRVLFFYAIGQKSLQKGPPLRDKVLQQDSAVKPRCHVLRFSLHAVTILVNGLIYYINTSTQ